ncbi:unnamed protein product [Angiostrongylus costaricensis]|uniref:AAA_8 domain-containing protein n=1 Tax=Angiostrongylus costaricensis TaxID=334426 RepID=A0A0R3PGP3_ANGCS|nr:unnamed protein product [Angiostrongylus costaricensis]
MAKWIECISVHSKCTTVDFDEYMRSGLLRGGYRNEKMCFIMDESNILDAGFLETLNTFWPIENFLFEFLFNLSSFVIAISILLWRCLVYSSMENILLLQRNPEKVPSVMRNLDVVFTMNPSGSNLCEHASTSSAPFNRCVASELTATINMDRKDYEPRFALPKVFDLMPSPPAYRYAVINKLVYVHKSVQKLNEQEQNRGHKVMVVMSRHFLDLVRHFTNLFYEERQELGEGKTSEINNSIPGPPIALNEIRETEE